MTILETHHGKSHDGGVAIYKDSAIVALAAERADRIKHSNNPEQALAFLASRLHVDPASASLGPVINHPLAHAASAYYASDFDSALILVVDGQGEYTDKSVVSLSLWMGEGLEIKPLEVRDEPAPFCTQSIGHFYSAITYYLGFGFYDQGKTMALAGYGKPGPMTTAAAAFCRYANGWIEVNAPFVKTVFDETHGEMFGWPKPVDHDFAKSRLEELLGKIRHKDEPITQHHCDLAYAGQAALEDALLRFCQHMRQKYPAHNLCLAGGVALNVAANTRIVREAGFRDVFIQPAAGDDGQALGKLLYRMHNEFSFPRKPMRHAYLGPGYDHAEIREVVSSAGDRFQSIEFEDRQTLLMEVIKRLLSMKVIAWFQGSSEIGPRALGHRSILADPRKKEMRDHVNAIKKRESFQPVALSILLEHAADWFDLPCPSPFMLLTAKAKEKSERLMPAGLHIDGTSRLQTLTQAENGLFYDLVSEYMRQAGVPALLNTSFNDKGEPIVETPNDAFKTFVQMEGIDVLVIGSSIIERKREVEGAGF